MRAKASKPKKKSNKKGITFSASKFGIILRWIWLVSYEKIMSKKLRSFLKNSSPDLEKLINNNGNSWINFWDLKKLVFAWTYENYFTCEVYKWNMEQT